MSGQHHATAPPPSGEDLQAPTG